jgi:hypothetical protein
LELEWWLGQVLGLGLELEKWLEQVLELCLKLYLLQVLGLCLKLYLLQVSRFPKSHFVEVPVLVGVALQIPR